MTAQVSSAACLCVFGQRKILRVRGVASEDSAVVKTTLEDKVRLGSSQLKVTRLGIGTWSWGDSIYWNDSRWNVSGSKLFLGDINSETLLGRFIKERKEKNPEVEVAVATKFVALPWRFSRQSVLTTLKDSLCWLGLSSIDLYQLHWPGDFIDGLGDAYEQGLVKAAGVSNYSGGFTYILINQNGVKAACDELGITLIAYCPIAQGALTGKYTPANPPTGPRGKIYTLGVLNNLKPLLNRIKEIREKYRKTPTQVALNWLIAQENVMPIPGAKIAEQATKFVGALGWRLTNEEVNELRLLASEISPVIGIPLGNF
ncbi:hypothetical protein SLE2022_211400 [Rubroshorea leprosula]